MQSLVWIATGYRFSALRMGWYEPKNKQPPVRVATENVNTM